MGEKSKCLTLMKLFIKRLKLLNSRVGDVEAMGIKEGHFTVVAAKNHAEEKPARVVVKLCVLKNPRFLRLLELAEEEYGYQQSGALAVPCRAEELHRILQDLEQS